MPHRTVGRGHSLFAEQVVSSRLGGLCTVRSSSVDQGQHSGTSSEESTRSTARQERVSLRSMVSGVDRPRVSPRFSTMNGPKPEGCPLLIPWVVITVEEVAQ